MEIGQRWIEEYVFRGRPQGSDQPSGWHIRVGTIVDNVGTPQAVVSDPLPVAAAVSAGLDLPEIAAMINQQQEVDLDAAEAALADASARMNGLQADLAASKVEAQSVRDELARVRAELLALREAAEAAAEPEPGPEGL